MYIDLTTLVTVDNPIYKWALTQENKHIAMGHVGTHLDTYKKTNIPLEYFKSEGIIFDVRNINEISEKNIDINLIKPNSFVIFRTGQLEKYNYGSNEYFKNHPHLSNSLIDILCKKNIRFIGIDTPGIKQGTEHEIADIKCEDNNIYVIENLSNLDKINKEKFIVYTMWLDDKNLTGLKCRIIIEY